MISETLQRIDGVTAFPIIGLALFFVMFAACVVWVIRLDKRYVSHMERMPLDAESDSVEETTP
jgi:hypothetical protein